MSHVNEKYLAFYRNNGETSNVLDDAEMEFLSVAGGGYSGAEGDRWYGFLRGQGYTGSLNDMLAAFKADGGLIKDYVPNVVGMTTAEATTALSDAGFTLGTVTGTIDPVASQSPTAGSFEILGTAVDLTLTG